METLLMYQLNFKNQNETFILSKENIKPCISFENFYEYKRNKLILNENDLELLEVWKNYNYLRNQLYNSFRWSDSILIQGSAFVIKGQAYLLMGVGGIDFLDSLSQMKDVEGIIGNGNSLFISKDFRHVYSANSVEELQNCYELEGSSTKINFIDRAPIAPLIFLLRSFKKIDEYKATKVKVGKILFETKNTFAGYPTRFAGTLKSRLRSKFIETARIVHCARRPTLMMKECLFDSSSDIKRSISNFTGEFSLVYTKWSQELCDLIGMKNTRLYSESYNPTDPITPYFVHIAKGYL